MEKDVESRWVADRLACIEPKWSPDAVHGRALVGAGLEPRRYSRAWMTAAATAAVVVAAIVIPETRAFAQDLWYRLILNRVQVVRVDLSKLPMQTEVTTNGSEEVVQGIGQAEQKAGFRPHLPPAEVLPATAKMAVIGPIAMKQTIRIRDLEAALRKAGAADVQVPAEWEGVTLRAEIGPMVSAGYPGEIQILQTKPFELFVPSGFSLGRFAEAAFRSIGASWWEARALGQKFAAHPAWFLDIPADEAVNVQEVALRAGPALLIEDFDDRGAVERVTVVYATSERMYSVSSGTRELSVRIANSLP